MVISARNSTIACISLTLFLRARVCVLDDRSLARERDVSRAKVFFLLPQEFSVNSNYLFRNTSIFSYFFAIYNLL